MSGIEKKRFWETVDVVAHAHGYSINLDERPLKTPAKATLVVHNAELARVIAEEWRSVVGKIDPDVLPYTRIANVVIDRISVNPAPVAEMITAYGENDLICYRATEPESLCQRQAAAWDAWVRWSEEELGAPLRVVAGVMHEDQHPKTLAALQREVASHNPYGLAALHDLVTISGSLVLGLAVLRGAIDAETAWTVSRTDEIWQIEQWGFDAEADALAQSRFRAFERAGHVAWMSCA